MTERREHSREKVIEALHGVAAEMHDRMSKGESPTMSLPVRTKKNIQFDKRLGVYKYGRKRTVRDASSLGSARQLLRALHIIEFIEEMIESGKSSTLREMYYISEGWGNGKFGSQNESNNLAEDRHPLPARGLPAATRGGRLAHHREHDLQRTESTRRVDAHQRPR